jgi:serine/threonine protein kinase
MESLLEHPHPNIPKMLLSFCDDFYFYIVMDYKPAIDLFQYAETNLEMTELVVKRIFRQVLAGISHLHSFGIVHRDIKVLLLDTG